MAANKKYKLLFITRKYPPAVGGMETFCYKLMQGLDRERFEVKLLALGKKQIHLIWFLPYVILYVLLFSGKYDGILVGDMLLCAAGFFCHKVSPKTQRVVAVHGLDITFSNRLYQFYLKLFGAKSFDVYGCNSKETQKLLEQYLHVIGKVIPLGVDVKRYKRTQRDRQLFKQKYGISENTLVLLTVGRLVKRKGVLWFVRNVLPSLQGNIVYIIIGYGPNYEKIEQEIAKKNSSVEIQLMGRVADDVLEDFYTNADVFVMPNIKVPGDPEGFGLVALEACLARNVVIASGIEGIQDAVIDGKNGFLLESGNADQYVKKIQDVQQDPELYARLAVEFSDYTEKYYSWDRVCRQYEGLLVENGD